MPGHLEEETDTTSVSQAGFVSRVPYQKPLEELNQTMTLMKRAEANNHKL